MERQGYNFPGKGVAVKLLGVAIVIALLGSGCTVSHRSEVIDTDKLGGYASGTYNDRSDGPSGRFAAGGSGFGAGAASTGFGAGLLCIETGPPPSGAYEFARAIAMINYSKKLKSIKYDEFGGVIDYEFEQLPASSIRSTQPGPGAKAKLRSSFGHQPVE